MSRPLVSVVIPTRNRPAFLRESLQSLRRQTFGDFEVIVSDNHTGQSAREVFDEVAGEGWQYRTPDRPLSMCDNWEYGCSFARGEYVAVLIDKTILIPSALELLHRLTVRDPVEVVTWRNEDYSVVPGDGFRRYTPDASGVQAPVRYDPMAELTAKLTFDPSRERQGHHYFRGKICFGAYRRSLLERITAAQGRVFYPACPDYTSMTAALALAESALDTGAPLLISTTTPLSNGAQCGQFPSAMMGFLTQTDPSGAMIDAMPLRGLYTSVHNLVAHDYTASVARLGARMAGHRVDPANLVLRALEDLHVIAWESAEQRRAQYAIVGRALAALPPLDRVRVVAGYARYVLQTRAPHYLKEQLKVRSPRAASLAQQLLRAGRQRTEVAAAAPLVCASIGEAAALADQAYRPLMMSAS